MPREITYIVKKLPPTYRCAVCGERFYGNEGAAVCENCGEIVCLKCAGAGRFKEHACGRMDAERSGK